MTYRIAFAGASGTGKTTLMNAINETLKLPVNPVGSRSVAKDMGFSSPYDVDKAGKRAEFQTRLLREKHVWEAQHWKEGFITDRTPFDNIAYTALHDVDSLTLNHLLAARDNLAKYTHVFYLPAIWSEIGDDPARKEGQMYHHIFGTLLKGFLDYELMNFKERLIDLSPRGREPGDVLNFLLHGKW